MDLKFFIFNICLIIVLVYEYFQNLLHSLVLTQYIQQAFSLCNMPIFKENSSECLLFYFFLWYNNLHKEQYMKGEASQWINLS